MVEINFPFKVFSFCKRFFLKVLFLWSIELFWIIYASLVMYLNSCFMELGRDTTYPHIFLSHLVGYFLSHSYLLCLLFSFSFLFNSSSRLSSWFAIQIFTNLILRCAGIPTSMPIPYIWLFFSIFDIKLIDI